MLESIFRNLVIILNHVLNFVVRNLRPTICGLAGGLIAGFLARLASQVPTTELMFANLGVPLWAFNMFVVVTGILLGISVSNDGR